MMVATQKMATLKEDQEEDTDQEGIRGGMATTMVTATVATIIVKRIALTTVAGPLGAPLWAVDKDVGDGCGVLAG